LPVDYLLLNSLGASVEESTLISLNVFELARMNYLAYAIGEPKPIPGQDIEEYQRRWKSGFRNRMTGPSTTGEHSDWRYHKELLKRQSLHQ
jgi:hypothetical protein